MYPHTIENMTNPIPEIQLRAEECMASLSLMNLTYCFIKSMCVKYISKLIPPMNFKTPLTDFGSVLIIRLKIRQKPGVTKMKGNQ